jgi:hypothetical protein
MKFFSTLFTDIVTKLQLSNNLGLKVTIKKLFEARNPQTGATFENTNPRNLWQPKN